MVSIQVTGLKELTKSLEQLSANVGKNVLRGAVRAGAKVVVDAVVLKAPVYQGTNPRIKPGIIKRSVYMKHMNKESTDTHQEFFVSIRRGKGQQAKGRDAFFWSWVEFGHHIIPRAKKGGASLSFRQAAVITGSSLISGAQYVLPRPFFRPAFESSKETAARAIREYLEKRIPEEVAKVASK